MRGSILTLAALAAAQPAAAEIVAWPMGTAGFVVRADAAEVATPTGRAALLRAIERGAGRLCNGVSPKVEHDGCLADVTAAAERKAGPRTAHALRLARAERDGVQLAAR